VSVTESSEELGKHILDALDGKHGLRLHLLQEAGKRLSAPSPSSAGLAEEAMFGNIERRLREYLKRNDAAFLERFEQDVKFHIEMGRLPDTDNPLISPVPGLREGCMKAGNTAWFVSEFMDALRSALASRNQQPREQSDVAAFLAEVEAELARARAKFPGDVVRTLAFSEEAGELVKAVLDEDAANVRKEAVQAAAMAARIVLDGDGSVTEWRERKGLDRLGRVVPTQNKEGA
jgi:hypothetical protein